MKLGWGWKIGILYGAFMVLIVSLVIASNRQHFDLVTNDYYEEEIAYQKVIDGGKNQSSLSRPMAIHADARDVIVEFPDEFKGKVLSGDIKFYAPVDAAWDKDFKLSADNNSMSIPRSALRNIHYTMKISCIADGKTYYQESEIILH